MYLDLSVFLSCVISVIQPNWSILSSLSVILASDIHRSVKPSRDEHSKFLPSRNSLSLNLVGPRTMDLGRKEIQTNLPRLGECELSLLTF